MIKRILPILLLLVPYLYIIPFYIAANSNNQSFNKLLYFTLWIILFLVLFILNVIFVIFRILHKEKSEFFLFWNMILKLCHVPIYLLVFLVGMLIAFFPVGFVLLPFFITFDYLLLILTSIYGISGVIQAKREGKLSIKAAVVLGVLHFIFCADVICSIIAFIKVKKANKMMKI